MSEPDCHGCGGNNTQQSWHSGMEPGTWEETECLNLRTGWKDLERAMEMYINCKTTRLGKECKGCEYERAEVLSMIYHYVENEKENVT